MLSLVTCRSCKPAALWLSRRINLLLTLTSHASGKPAQAAAAMVVGVGSLSDPANMQGLSHYLEHMLFMGSEKFPDENDYDSFLSKNGGGSNAYTELVRRVQCRKIEEPCSNHKRSSISC